MLAFLRAHLVALFWDFRKPRYRSGDVVKNRYEDATATLKFYLGPYVGYSDDGRWIVTERWETTDGNKVAVGYYWVKA